jgi:hypothetical protein
MRMCSTLWVGEVSCDAPRCQCERAAACKLHVCISYGNDYNTPVHLLYAAFMIQLLQGRRRLPGGRPGSDRRLRSLRIIHTVRNPATSKIIRQVATRRHVAADTRRGPRIRIVIHIVDVCQTRRWRCCRSPRPLPSHILIPSLRSLAHRLGENLEALTWHAVGRPQNGVDLLVRPCTDGCVLLLSFLHVCPEPVLVKKLLFYIKEWTKMQFSYRHQSGPARKDSLIRYCTSASSIAAL